MSIISSADAARVRLKRAAGIVGKQKKPPSPAQGPEQLALALQGGGSYGAFTWGVLDRGLEENISLDMVSGTSAGALNAVLLASGLAEDGPQGAKRKLARFWKRVSEMAPPHVATSIVELAGSLVSPYLLNPLGLNPLRDLLEQEVDFEQLREVRPVRLMIAATRVRDGRLRLFREDEISLDAVLASCCLPRLHHAVVIDGEEYWDGGFSANPPLRRLVIETSAETVVLVQLLPEHGMGHPRHGTEISQRLSGIAFNEPLLKELEALEDLRLLCRDQGTPSALCRKINRLKIHRIVAERAVPNLAKESPLHADWPMLTRLHAAGRAAAEGWIAGHQDLSQVTTLQH